MKKQGSTRMQRLASKLAFVMAITAIGVFGADRQAGTWKVNASNVKSTAANRIASRTEVYEATPDGGMKVTKTDQRADGASLKYSYTCKYDGKACPVAGALYDTISFKRIDTDTTSYETRKTGGVFHTTGRVVVSKDGKTKTQTTTGTGVDGKPVATTMVYNKQ